jgi:uncharacterized membrane protein YfcA
MSWLSFAAALVTGILASLGVGGGMVLIIFLTVVAGVDQLTAQGINLIYFIPIALLSVIIHTKNKMIEWRRIVPAIITGLAGAVIGAFIARAIDREILHTVFAVFVLLIGIKELFYKEPKEENEKNAAQPA